MNRALAILKRFEDPWLCESCNYVNGERKTSFCQRCTNDRPCPLQCPNDKKHRLNPSYSTLLCPICHVLMERKPRTFDVNSSRDQKYLLSGFNVKWNFLLEDHRPTFEDFMQRLQTAVNSCSVPLLHYVLSSRFLPQWRLIELPLVATEASKSKFAKYYLEQGGMVNINHVEEIAVPFLTNYLSCLRRRYFPEPGIIKIILTYTTGLHNYSFHFGQRKYIVKKKDFE